MALVDLYEGKLIALEDYPGAIAHQPVPEDIFNQDVLGPNDLKPHSNSAARQRQNQYLLVVGILAKLLG